MKLQTVRTAALALPETTEEKVLELANNITHQIGNEVFDIDNESFSLTTSIGITLLNENVPSVERALERSQEAIDQLRNKSEVGNGVKLYIPDIHSDEVSKTEAVAITAKINESCLKRVFYPCNLGEIDVAAKLALRAGFKVEFLDLTALDDGDPGLLGMRGIDQHGL